MFTKAAALTIVAALAGQVTAFNAHRNLHAERDAINKREVHVQWVTEHQTVTVVAGQPTGAPSNNDFVNHKQVLNPEVAYEQPEGVPEPPKELPADPTQEPAPAPPAATTKAPKAKPSSTGSTSDRDSSEGGNDNGKALFSHKRGLAYNNDAKANLMVNDCPNCGWAYNWGANRGDLSEDISFVPTLWGNTDDHTKGFDEACEAALKSGSKAIFSFNEPDQDSESNIPLGEAVASHAELLGKYKGRAQIGAPSVTNGTPQENKGVYWLKQFVSACKDTEGCHFDFCNVHWYSEPQYNATLFEHIDAAHEACDGKPIWLTEFGPNTKDPVQKSNFMSEVLPKLDAIDYLEGYSYFWVDEELVNGNSLSETGQLYVSV